jgi:endogenous inhibitor of DNA gyrase (YacG/DUF329 family)
VLCAGVANQKPIGNYHAEIEWENGGYAFTEPGPIGHIEENQTKGNTGAVKHCEECGRFVPVDVKTGKMYKHTLFLDTNAICSQSPQASDSVSLTDEEAMMKMRKCPFCSKVVQLDDSGRFMPHSTGKTSVTACRGAGKTYKQKEPINKTPLRIMGCDRCGHMVEVNNRGQFVTHNMNGKQGDFTEPCVRSGAYVAPPITPPYRADFKKQRMFGKCDTCGKSCEITLDGEITRHMRKMILSDGTPVTEECPGKNYNKKGSLLEKAWVDIDAQIDKKTTASRASMTVAAPYIKSKVMNKHAIQPYEPVDLDGEEEPEDYPNDGTVRNNKDGFISIW